MNISELRRRTVLTVPEAAEVLGIGTGSAAYRAREQGVFPSIKVGGQWRVPVPPLLRMLGVDVDDDEPEPSENVTPLRRAR